MRFTQAIYLPVWHIDHVVSLQQRVRGCVQQVEIASRDWRIPATHVEPFASIPLTVPDNSILVEDAETYNVQKHSNVFKQDDMPAGEPVIRPVVIPFSSMLPNLEDVYRKAASTYWDDNDISFLGEVKTRLQLEYPLLLPFYLVEVADLNPQYHGETVSYEKCLHTNVYTLPTDTMCIQTTCLLMGRQVSPFQQYDDKATLQTSSADLKSSLSLSSLERADSLLECIEMIDG